MTDLFIIEAQGKRARLINILASEWDSPFEVQASYGRLIDLDNKAPGHGINMDTLLPKKWSPTRPSVFEAVKQAVEGASRIFVATDYDDAGEFIAWQIAKSFPEHKNKMARVRFRDMSPESVMNAVAAAKFPITLDNEVVSGVIDRRVFDRLTGFQKGQQKGEVIGRVQTPLMKLLSDYKGPAGEVRYQIDDAEGPWLIKVLLDQKLIDRASKVPFLLAESGLKVTPSGSKNTGKVKQKNYFEFLHDLSINLGLDVPDVGDKIQSLYEEGELSYSRTDSRELSEEAVDYALDAFPHISSRPSFDPGRLANRKPSAHPAVFVTGEVDVDSLFCSGDLSPKGRILKEVALYGALSISDIRIFREQGEIDPSTISEELKELLSKPGCSITCERLWQSSGEIITPFAVAEEADWNIILYSASQMAVKWMNELGVGQPGSALYHAKRINAFVLKGTLSLNNAGKASLSRAESIAPDFCDIKAVQEINRALRGDKAERLAIIQQVADASPLQTHFQKDNIGL